VKVLSSDPLSAVFQNLFFKIIMPECVLLGDRASGEMLDINYSAFGTPSACTPFGVQQLKRCPVRCDIAWQYGCYKIKAPIANFAVYSASELSHDRPGHIVGALRSRLRTEDHDISPLGGYPSAPI
jgi:hypothetical protein